MRPVASFACAGHVPVLRVRHCPSSALRQRAAGGSGLQGVRRAPRRRATGARAGSVRGAAYHMCCVGSLTLTLPSHRDATRRAGAQARCAARRTTCAASAARRRSARSSARPRGCRWTPPRTRAPSTAASCASARWCARAALPSGGRMSPGVLRSCIPLNRDLRWLRQCSALPNTWRGGRACTWVPMLRRSDAGASGP